MSCKNCKVECRTLYCSSNCKSQYYYKTKDNVREAKIKNASNKNKYYVYSWTIKGDTNPFYIGKGSGNRAFTITGRSQRIKEFLIDKEFEVKILKENMSNENALSYERRLINTLPNLVNVNDRDVDKTLKVCSVCRVEKDYQDDFYHNTSCSAMCKDCISEKNRQYTESNKIKNEKMLILDILLKASGKGGYKESPIESLYKKIYG